MGWATAPTQKKFFSKTIDKSPKRCYNIHRDEGSGKPPAFPLKPLK